MRIENKKKRNNVEERTCQALRQRVVGVQYIVERRETEDKKA